MSFAQKILQKYGWKEGDGLGKDNTGMTKPLKASLKFDSAGFGVDRAEEFNNHWWERVFNEAANNVKVDKVNGDVTVNVKNDESVEITTKEYSVRKLKQKKRDAYDNFLLSATLTNTGDEVSKPDKIEVDEIKVAPHRVLTDEELFAACGGRTAHKGARHGLKLSGKLARLEQQEKELLLKMQGAPPEANSSDWTVVKSKKKKKEKKTHQPDEAQQEVKDENASKIDDVLYTAEYCIKSKKKRKEKKKTEEELSECLDVISLGNKSESEALLGINDLSKAIKKSKKSKKSKKAKKNKEDADWEAHRDCAPMEQEIIDDCADKPLLELNDNEDGTKVQRPEKKKKKKSKKCKHGIDKEAKEAYKESKKMKKKLKKITENLEKSYLEVA